MGYLRDTNAVIAVLKDADSPVGARLRREAPGEVFLSSIVLHELFYGAFKVASGTERGAGGAAALRRAGVFGGGCAWGREGAGGLAVKGTPIGPYDVLIAGQALARGLVLVNRNGSELGRVKQLRIEEWKY